MKDIGSFLNNNPRYRKLQKPLEAAEVCEAARTIANNEYQIISYKNGLLTIGCTSAGQAANLRPQFPTIIQTINKKLGKNLVEKIRTKMA